MGIAVGRDISLLWLIFLTLIAVLPPAIILFFAIMGMNRLRQLVKKFLPVVQDKAELVAVKTGEYSFKVARPVIETYARAAQVQGLTRATFRRKRT